MKMSDYKSNSNILTVTNMSWVLEHGYNLFSTILLARKSVKAFLRKVVLLSEIIVNKKIFGLAYKSIISKLFN